MWQWLIRKFDMSDPSDYEDYYDNISWKTFRVDDSIWGDAWRKLKISYFRELQHCYEQLLKESSESFLYDVNSLKRVFNEMHLKNCELEKELEIAKGKNLVLQDRLDEAMRQLSATGKKNMLLESQGLEPVTVSVQKEGNRFTGKSGSAMKDNMMLSAAYFENGWELKEISEELEVSENTVKSYVSTMRKHYKVQMIQGRKHIVFDSDYGECDWDLCLYERLSVKYPTGNTVAV